MAFACMRIRPRLTALALIPLLSPTVASADVSAAAIEGIVRSDTRTPVVAIVSFTSPSGRYRTTTDKAGHFVVTGLAADTYTASIEAEGYEPETLVGVTLTPGATLHEDFRILKRELRTIGRATASSRVGTNLGQANDTYVVTQTPTSAQLTGTVSGDGAYMAGTVLGNVANLPGISSDQYSDIIVRGSKTSDSIFQLDGVPFPQEFVSTPGGTTFGSPLTNIGVGSTIVQQAGFIAGGDNAFGAIVNEIPISGSYPGSRTFSFGTGLTTGSKSAEFQLTGATRDNRFRWALAGRSMKDQFPIGNGVGQPGTNFYTSVAGGNSLDYTSQAATSAMTNLHDKLGQRGDLQLLLLAGNTHYDQYGQPYTGLTSAAADGLNTTYPGANPYAPVTTPGKDNGSFSLQSLKYALTNAQSFGVVHYSRGINSGSSHFIVGSDNTYPIGWDSYSGDLWTDVHTLGIDVQNQAGTRHQIAWGVDLRSSKTDLTQVEPIIDDLTNSITRSNSVSAYLGDTFDVTRRLQIVSSLRAQDFEEIRIRDGNKYNIAAVDPHIGASYRFGKRYSVTANYDHIDQAPLPYAIDRHDSSAPVPFVPITFERGDHFTYSLVSRGPVNFRATYWRKNEYNRLDILPTAANVQSASTSVSASPTSIGLPANLGLYKAHGADFEVNAGAFSVTGTYTREIGMDSSQYSLNQVNPAQIAAQHLIPGSFFPDFSGTASFRFQLGKKTTITPQISYESGLPYGNGTKLYIADPVTGQPTLVNNDNHVNPGYAYSFLKDPSQPHSATNPYTADLGTGEGSDPQSLRAAPRTFVSLHITHQLSRHMSLSLDGSNLLNFTGPIELLSNGYAPGPPGYKGGDPLIAAWMQTTYGKLGSYRKLPYILGNGVPTVDGYHPEFGPQFNYGTGPYVTAALPYRRQIKLTVTIVP